jgi:hypothetical protein
MVFEKINVPSYLFKFFSKRNALEFKTSKLNVHIYVKI